MSQHYSGTELSLFAQAHNWKSYVASLLQPWLGRRVLDVGAGIGGNIPALFTDPVKEWVALEPDADLAGRIKGASRVVAGTLAALDKCERFEAILYLDVLEHIANDAEELLCAMRYLAPGGRLIVLVPAHQFLFSPFDSAIGHHRRYNRDSLRRIGPGNGRLEQLLMLDSAGLLASLANKLLLRSANPSLPQVRFWDQTMVPLSRALDRLAGYHVGKSVLAVWSLIPIRLDVDTPAVPRRHADADRHPRLHAGEKGVDCLPSQAMTEVSGRAEGSMSMRAGIT